MRHLLARALLIIGAPLVTARGFAATNGTPLEPVYQVDLERKFLQTAASDQQLSELKQRAFKRASVTTFRDFSKLIRLCAFDGAQAARVVDSTQERVWYMERELNEPAGLDRAGLRTYYTKRLASEKSVQEISPKIPIVWEFGLDVIMAVARESDRKICVQPGIAANEAVEYLAHELVHFADSVGGESSDVLRYPSARAYALKVVLEPGDEVDAYRFQYALRRRLRGRDSVPHTMDLRSREEFARYIVDEMGYLNSRFVPQRKQLVRSLLSALVNRLAFSRELLQLRRTQAAEHTAFVATRSRALDFAWPKHREITLQARGYARTESESVERLTAEIRSLESRKAQLGLEL